MVAGIEIPGGLIYVGTSLSCSRGGDDPCLINPTKSVGKQGDYTQREMGYWPSYSEIPPTARRAFLNWLADGREDPEADIGYVFLFFYGLERRVILDAAEDEIAKADLPVIAAELRRLLRIYGAKSSSFQGYAGSLLDWIALAGHHGKLYLEPVPDLPKTYELPFSLRLALGQAAVAGAPLPAPLALAWVKLDPATNLRTPATRCGGEFERLFLHRYQAAFGAGLVLPKNKTKLKYMYRPASAGLHGHGGLRLDFGDLPDVTVLTGPIQKLRQLVESATKELDSYSRFVGKNPEAKQALEGLLDLPALLWPEGFQKRFQELRAQIGDGTATLTFKEILDSLGAHSTLTREKTLTLARVLEGEDIGIEPDILGGARLPKPDGSVVLFLGPLRDDLNRRAPSFQAAELTLQLAAAVASADGEFGIEEIDHLQGQVTSWTHLAPGHIRRLVAHIHLLAKAPLSLAVLQKKLEPLDKAAREAIGTFMATVAQSDGTISPSEMKVLERVYMALGIDTKKVFSDLHAVASGSQTSVPTGEPTKDAGFKLDPKRIAALQKDTEAVSALLSTIFVEDEPPVTVAAEAALEPETQAMESGLLGLDEAHSAFARLLLSRPEWTKEELGDIAADLDLMVGGAIETLNEAAYNQHDIPFVEGEDPVLLNPDLLEKIAA